VQSINRAADDCVAMVVGGVVPVARAFTGKDPEKFPVNWERIGGFCERHRVLQSGANRLQSASGRNQDRKEG
jgi:hypothetical protein